MTQYGPFLLNCRYIAWHLRDIKPFLQRKEFWKLSCRLRNQTIFYNSLLQRWWVNILVTNLKRISIGALGLGWWGSSVPFEHEIDRITTFAKTNGFLPDNKVLSEIKAEKFLSLLRYLIPEARKTWKNTAVYFYSNYMCQ